MQIINIPLRTEDLTLSRPELVKTISARMRLQQQAWIDNEEARIHFINDYLDHLEKPKEEIHYNQLLPLMIGTFLFITTFLTILYFLT